MGRPSSRTVPLPAFCICIWYLCGLTVPPQSTQHLSVMFTSRGYHFKMKMEWKGSKSISAGKFNTFENAESLSWEGVSKVQRYKTWILSSIDEYFFLRFVLMWMVNVFGAHVVWYMLLRTRALHFFFSLASFIALLCIRCRLAQRSSWNPFCDGRCEVHT